MVSSLRNADSYLHFPEVLMRVTRHSLESLAGFLTERFLEEYCYLGVIIGFYEETFGPALNIMLQGFWFSGM